MLIFTSFVTSPIEIPLMVLPGVETGACVDFQGIVRQTENGRALDGLFYEAYEPMATRTLHRMFNNLAEKHPCQSVEFIHRLGWVPVGEASLFVRVCSSHRGEAFRFCAEAIDRMKQDVPIWKRLDDRNAPTA